MEIGDIFIFIYIYMAWARHFSSAGLVVMWEELSINHFLKCSNHW